MNILCIAFPESARMYGIKGVDCLICPWVSTILIPARSIENACFAAYINYSGPHFCGTSVVSATDGTIIAQSNETEALSIVNIDNEKYKDFKDSITYIDDMRPDV